MLAQSPDEVLAAVGDRLEGVVVTWDTDFKALVSKMPHGTRARFRKLGRILFQCKESQGRNRLEQVIALLDFAFEQTQARPDTRFIMTIGASFVRFDF